LQEASTTFLYLFFESEDGSDMFFRNLRFSTWEINLFHGNNLYIVSGDKGEIVVSIARVFRRDSPPTRCRRSEGSGGESSSMLTSVEGNAVQAFSVLL
jgi:hypothetical protein